MLYQDSELLSEALQRYYQANALPPDGGMADKWARYKLGPFHAIAFPNFALRNQALRRHDVHHILNNLDTSPKCEGLIAAWELGSGCGKYWISWFMESQALWWGILLSPQKAMELFLVGKRSKNFFLADFDGSILNQKVGALRSQMLFRGPAPRLTPGDFVHFILLALLGIGAMLIFAPIVIGFTLIGLLIGAHRHS